MKLFNEFPVIKQKKLNLLEYNQFNNGIRKSSKRISLKPKK